MGAQKVSSLGAEAHAGVLLRQSSIGQGRSGAGEEAACLTRVWNRLQRSWRSGSMAGTLTSFLGSTYPLEVR